jgi:hypothetical protein
MNDWLHDVFRDRPWWMNAMMVFCAYMTFVYMPWDIFVKAAEVDQEVWFGYTFTGTAAKWAAIPHWLVYAAGLYGFRRMRPWMGIAGTIYLAQVALSMFMWPILNYDFLLRFILAVIPAIPFGLLTMAFWNAREVFCVECTPLRERYGDWALVTGASAGIGEEIAKHLAAEGVSCVLSARREDHLQALAVELERQHGIATRTVPLDLSEEGGADRLADAVEDLEIGILINNAGFGYAGRFEKLDASRLRQMIQLNCVAPTLLAHRLLPGMRERGRGAMIITGSVSGRQPLPLHSVYSATKAFDLHLGEALFVEMRDAGVDVMVLEPGATQTEFGTSAGQLDHSGHEVSAVVKTAFEALGHQPSVIAGWLNWIRANAASRFAPRPLVAYVARHVMQQQTPPDMR